jgi:hypothetical protein
MKIEIAAFRLLGAVFLALGFTLGGALATAAPASAQEPPQETPWYMPQPWVHPPQTGPSIRKLPGYYGHNLRYRTYGNFSTSCYGFCSNLPGTIGTGYGVTFSRPVVAYFDPRYYAVVPQQGYQAQQPYQAQQIYVLQRNAAPARAKVVPVRYAQWPSQKPLPKFSTQNGVRIIRPAPMATY